MNENTEADIRAHAVASFPKECCGLIAVVDGREIYFPCNNIATTPLEHFILDPLDYERVDNLGEIIAIVHSHPKVPAQPSQGDLVSCEAHGLPWHIVHVSLPGSMPGDEHTPPSDVPATGEMVTFYPTGYEAPLVGREFVFGVLDCYALIRDYYLRELGMELPEFERRDKFWVRGEDLYMDNYEAAGFAPVKGAIQVGDIIYMEYHSSNNIANHAGVYIGNGLILHHLAKRLSSRDVYDGYWQQATRLVIRHKDRT